MFFLEIYGTAPIYNEKRQRIENTITFKYIQNNNKKYHNGRHVPSLDYSKIITRATVYPINYDDTPYEMLDELLLTEWTYGKREVSRIKFNNSIFQYLVKDMEKRENENVYSGCYGIKR